MNFPFKTTLPTILPFEDDSRIYCKRVFLFYSKFSINPDGLSESFSRLLSHVKIIVSTSDVGYPFCIHSGEYHYYMIVVNVDLNTLNEIHSKMYYFMKDLYRIDDNKCYDLNYSYIKYFFDAKNPLNPANIGQYCFLVGSSTISARNAEFQIDLIRDCDLDPTLCSDLIPVEPKEWSNDKIISVVKTNSSIIDGSVVISNGEINDLGDGLFMLTNASLLIINGERIVVGYNDRVYSTKYVI
jgi:hypothetical protein